MCVGYNPPQPSCTPRPYHSNYNSPIKIDAKVTTGDECVIKHNYLCSVLCITGVNVQCITGVPV